MNAGYAVSGLLSKATETDTRRERSVRTATQKMKMKKRMNRAMSLAINCSISNRGKITSFKHI